MSAEDSQLVVTVPTTINVMIDGNGDFITPSEGSVYFENGSVFPVRLSKLHLTKEDWYTLSNLNNIDSATGNNLLAMKLKFCSLQGCADHDIFDTTVRDKFTQNGDTGGFTLSADGCLTMGRNNADNNGNRVTISYEGKIKNITEYLGEPKQFATINWTFTAAG